QRVALARAIAADAEVLILQDPTTALDSVTEQVVAERVRDARRGMSTVVYTNAPAWTTVADSVSEHAAAARASEGEDI
ncbi:MAG: ABC transporter ATP-binding protein, partial [Corynebacterium striatum]|nr:ABC transporter ATP-binding protein [Corynebacterium striatum]